MPGERRLDETDGEAEMLRKAWFYKFRLPSGRETECFLPDSIRGIHDTRLAMMWDALDPFVGAGWSKVRALDLACNQGWFACHLAARGCSEVCGLDVRPENVADAQLAARALGLGNARFRQGDVAALDAGELGAFDVVLMFGLLYHLEDPIGAIRRARAVTRGVCLIETQIAPEQDGTVHWGSRDIEKRSRGAFVLIDEADEAHLPTASVGAGLSLCPTRNALLWTMERAGFRRVEVLRAPPGAYEQLASGERLIVAGYA